MKGPRRHKLNPDQDRGNAVRPLTVPVVTAALPTSGERPFRSLLASIVLHGALFTFLVWQTAVTVADSQSPGLTGLRGGGGGGGGRRVTLIALSPLQSQAQTPPVSKPVPAPTVVPTVIREIREITPLVTPVSIRTLQRPLPLARVDGNQPGILGGPGSGTGSGGGVGSGTGPGEGSGVGPGTGGEGGGVFPPTIRRTELPPLPKPDAVKGLRFVVTFTVDENGRVVDAEITPEVHFAAAWRRSNYRKRWLDVLRRYRFRPAVRADGERIPGTAVIVVTL